MPYKFWLTAEIKFLRKNIKTMPLPELAKHLNRTEEGVIRKAYELGIQPTQPMNRWSAEDLYIAQTLPPEEAAAQTGRTLQSIRMKLSRLKAA